MDLNSTRLQVQTHDGQTLSLDMTELYIAENRIHEVQAVNYATANELATCFNKACNTTSKYISWIEYEILKAEKELDLARAEVIIDKMPIEVEKLPKGLKPNDDWRNALIARDPNCSILTDKILSLKAIKALLAAKLKTFERSFYTCYREKDRKHGVPSVNTTTVIGELENKNLDNVDPEILKLYR